MQRRHRRAHTSIWTGLAIGLPIVLILIFASMPKPPGDAPAVRLDLGPAQGGQP